MKNARRKLEVPMPAAMPCWTRREDYSETCSVLDKCETKYAYSVWKELYTKIMKIILQGERVNHYNLVHKFLPVPHAMQRPDAKAAAEREWENLKRCRHGSWRKSGTKKEVTAEVRNERKTAHVRQWIYDISEIRSWSHSLRNNRVVPGGDIVEDDPGSCAVFFWARIIGVTNGGCKSQGQQIKTSRTFRTGSWCSIRLYPGKNGRCSTIIENSQSQNVQTFGFVYHDTNGINHGPVWTPHLVSLFSTTWWKQCSQFPFSSMISTSPERLTHPWMYWWRNMLKIIGTFMEIENCQIRG